MSETKAPDALLEEIRGGHRFLLTSHINPDGDAVGSSIALARVLRALGGGATIWLRDPCPPLYQQLTGAGSIHSGEEPPRGFPDEYEGAIVLECPALDRCGLAEHLTGLPLLNIDHHLGNELYGKVNWVDTAAPSLGEMIYRLARAVKVSIDQDTANAMLLTLYTDTGGFRFANASPSAFRAAAELTEAGAEPQQVAEWLYESRSESSVRLLGGMLSSLELHADGQLATALLSREMVAAAEAQPGDSEGLIDYPRSIAGVRAVAMLRQMDGDEFKVSLRSTGDIDVERIARGHGGGGHRNAAGFNVEGTVAELRAAVVEQLVEALG